MRARLFPASAAIALLLCASPAAAELLGFTGSFQEDYSDDLGGDTFLVSNDPASESVIEQVVLDLSGSSGGAVFDPADFPFTILAGDPVGFDGVFDLSPDNLTLTLSFTDFDPGETFAFAVDVDDSGNSPTRGKDFAGASLDVTYEFVMAVLSAFYAADPNNPGRAVVAALNAVPAPEPDTGTLLALGLLGLASARRIRRRS